MKVNDIALRAHALLNNARAYFGAIPLKIRLLFIFVPLAVLLLAFVVLGWLPVHREVKHISNGLMHHSGNASNGHNLANFDLAHQVVKSEHHEAILHSNLLLAKADSISLIIDLSESLAILSFKGVNLFQSKISAIKYNKGLEKLPLFMLDSLFSGPFVTEQEVSSIEKFPIVVKKAPKDSIEANLAKKAPELPKYYDVFWFFTFNNHLTIEILQEEKDLIGAHSDYKKYQHKKLKWLRRKDLDALFQPDHRGYTYQLSIEIPREDARSIYRALPINPMVLVRY